MGWYTDCDVNIVQNRENRCFFDDFHGFVVKIVKTCYSLTYPRMTKHMTKILSVYNKISALRERYYGASVGKQSLLTVIGDAEVAEPEGRWDRDRQAPAVETRAGRHQIS